MRKIFIKRRHVIVERRRIAKKAWTARKRMSLAKQVSHVTLAPLAAEVHELLKDGPIRFPVELF